jgi:N-acetyl-beta-hexosaminidase
MPAHAASWGRAFEGLVVNCSSYARRQNTPHNIYPLDPSDPRTFAIAREVLRQLAGVFTSQFFHIGEELLE